LPRLSHSAFFHLRRRSLLRGNLIVLASLLVSFPLVGFPAGRRNPLLIFPALTALYGTFETVRCVRPERDLYHAGVILFLWMDSMAVCLILVFLLAPFIF
jgi:hypothetical protein